MARTQRAGQKVRARSEAGKALLVAFVLESVGGSVESYGHKNDLPQLNTCRGPTWSLRWLRRASGDAGGPRGDNLSISDGVGLAPAETGVAEQDFLVKTCVRFGSKGARDKKRRPGSLPCVSACNSDTRMGK